MYLDDFTEITPDGSWVTGNITTEDYLFYGFYADSTGTVVLEWDDMNNGTGNYTNNVWANFGIWYYKDSTSSVAGNYCWNTPCIANVNDFEVNQYLIFNMFPSCGIPHSGDFALRIYYP